MANNLKKKIDIHKAYIRLFNSEDGKKVLRDLLKSTGAFELSMDTTDRETAFNEGRKSVALRILRTINADPEKLYAQLDNQED